MSTAVLEKIDGKLMVAVPHDLQDEMNLLEGESVAFDRSEDKLILRRLPHYALEQLIAEHREIAGQLEEERAWLNASPVGGEPI